MTKEIQPQPPNQKSEMSTLSLIEILIVLSKNKRKILLFPTIFTIIGIIASFMLPNIYSANTKLLPPQQSQSTTSAMLSQLGLAGGSGAALGIKNPSDLYIALLKSRVISDELIKRFDLKNRYNQKYIENTRIKLEQNTTIVAGKDNIISIDFEDKDPKIAAEIANAYAEELAILTGKVALTEASQRRVFYEKQLDLAKGRMISAENLLATNIPNSGLISVDTQSKALLDTTAKLRASISAKEIHLKAMQTFLTPNSPQYKSALQELNGMKAELSKLESGSNNEISSSHLKQELDNSNKKAPFAGANNFQLLRDVKYYQMLYEMLSKQYELAKIDEAKDMPIIQVLDKAIEPEYKSKPKRALIIIAAFFLGLSIALLLIFLNEKFMNMSSEEEINKLRQLKENLRNFKL